jgi:hypothetical protein
VSLLGTSPLDFGVFDELAVILYAFMACLLLFMPLRVVAPDKLQEVFFGFYVRNTDEIVYIAVANLASIFHFTQSTLQQQLIWSQ